MSLTHPGRELDSLPSPGSRLPSLPLQSSCLSGEFTRSKLAKTSAQWGFWLLDTSGVLCPTSPVTAQKLGGVSLRSPRPKLFLIAVYNLYPLLFPNRRSCNFPAHSQRMTCYLLHRDKRSSHTLTPLMCHLVMYHLPPTNVTASAPIDFFFSCSNVFLLFIFPN